MNAKVLLAGATGATGRLALTRLLELGATVRAFARSADRLPESARAHERCEPIEASLLDLSDAELAEHAAGCDAIVSCLGHNITFSGIFGPPRRLVTDATRRLCEAARSHSPSKPVKFVLMNTAGAINPDESERVSFAERCVLAAIRALIPPHADNEQAAAYLRSEIGPDHPMIEWVAVRPDSLIDADTPSPRSLHRSPTRSAIFNSGKSSRINVAHFIADLVADESLWTEWKGRSPVLYNSVSFSYS